MESETEQRWEKPNVFFWLVIPACMAFVITLLSLVAARMGKREAPINGWLDRYADILLTVEVIAILLFALLAMATDRRKLIEQRNSESAAESESEKTKTDPQPPAPLAEPASNR